jgi:hypothetical protein
MATANEVYGDGKAGERIAAILAELHTDLQPEVTRQRQPDPPWAAQAAPATNDAAESDLLV